MWSHHDADGLMVYLTGILAYPALHPPTVKKCHQQQHDGRICLSNFGLPSLRMAVFKIKTILFLGAPGCHPWHIESRIRQSTGNLLISGRQHAETIRTMQPSPVSQPWWLVTVATQWQTLPVRPAGWPRKTKNRLAPRKGVSSPKETKRWASMSGISQCREKPKGAPKSMPSSIIVKRTSKPSGPILPC